MRKSTQALFILSLLLNILLAGALLYVKRDAIKGRLRPAPVVSIKAFNKVTIPPFTEVCSAADSAKQLKVLLIGNSILYHPLLNAVGWKHVSGMAASSAEQDYGHLVFKELQSLNRGRVCVRMANVAEKFERNLIGFKTDDIKPLVAFNPDLVVFQLGENVSLDSLTPATTFEASYLKLINAFKSDRKAPVTICTLPFFPSAQKNTVIERVAQQSGSFVVDLSHLALDESNYAGKDSSITTGEKAEWKDAGVGAHPGNIGMANIARQIMITIEANLKSAQMQKAR